MSPAAKKERTRRNFTNKSNRYDAKRERLVLCARGLAEDGDARKVSVTDVTSAMGITRGLFYYYFDGKDELYQSISNSYVSDLMKAIVEACASCETREESLHAIVTSVDAWLFDENGDKRPMWQVVQQMKRMGATMAAASEGIANYIMENDLLAKTARQPDEVLAEHARFVATGILGEAMREPRVNLELLSATACAALRYRKRRA